MANTKKQLARVLILMIGSSLLGGCLFSSSASVPVETGPPPVAPDQITARSCEEVLNIDYDLSDEAGYFATGERFVACGHDTELFERLVIAGPRQGTDTGWQGVGLYAHLEQQGYPVAAKLAEYLQGHQGAALWQGAGESDLPMIFARTKAYLTEAGRPTLCDEMEQAGTGARDGVISWTLWYLREAQCQGNITLAQQTLSSDDANGRYGGCKTLGLMGGGRDSLERIDELARTDATQDLYSHEPAGTYSVRVACSTAAARILANTMEASTEVGEVTLNYSDIEGFDARIYLPAEAEIFAAATSAQSVTYNAPSPDRRVPWSIRIGRIGANSLEDAERTVTSMMGTVGESGQLSGGRFLVVHNARGVTQTIDVFGAGMSAHCEGPAAHTDALRALCQSFIPTPQ